ncbi:MAG: hypothetical protein KAI66_27580 [Lentisphaeria bacterium]|nr:hypothetical protein [Lentisphaeria bacterium]
MKKYASHPREHIVARLLGMDMPELARGAALALGVSMPKPAQVPVGLIDHHMKREGWRHDGVDSWRKDGETMWAGRTIAWGVIHRTAHSDEGDDLTPSAVRFLESWEDFDRKNVGEKS